MLRPLAGIASSVGGEELPQDIIVLSIPFILAAVEVAQVGSAIQRESVAVGQGRIKYCPPRLGLTFQLLKISCLAVPGVAGNQYQSEFTGENRRRQFTIKSAIDIDLSTKSVEATGTAVAVMALTIQRQQIADERVRVRRDYSPVA